jgi:ABC-type ATPase with predicted acetyltransferase domain
MYRFDVCTAPAGLPPAGPKAAELIRLFGIRQTRLSSQTADSLKLEVRPGEIVFITGASGAGKSVLLNALYAQAPADARQRLEETPLEEGQSVIDCLGEDGDSPLLRCLEVLSKAVLSDVFCMLREPKRLSEGQQARYRLARALMSGRRLIFADEFTSSMDRITAAVIAYNIRKTARQTGTSFILASCHEDILPELRPETLIIRHGGGKTEIIYRGP